MASRPEPRIDLINYLSSQIGGLFNSNDRMPTQEELGIIALNLLQVMVTRGHEQRLDYPRKLTIQGQLGHQISYTIEKPKRKPINYQNVLANPQGNG